MCAVTDPVRDARNRGGIRPKTWVRHGTEACMSQGENSSDAVAVTAITAALLVLSRRTPRDRRRPPSFIPRSALTGGELDSRHAVSLAPGPVSRAPG